MVDNLLSVDEGSAGQNFRVTTDASGPLEMRTVPNLQTPDGVAAIYAANWAIANWYLDGVVGLDTNNGTAPATPLRTGAELCRRLGAYALWGQSVTVHVLANGMTDALVLKGCMLVAGTHLDVIGTPTVLASDVVGSYAALNHATPVATQITGTAIVDWTLYQWRRLRNTNPLRQGSVAWVATANPAGAGVAVARVSVPGALNLTATNSIFTSGTAWLFGDTFVVESLPAIPEVSIVIDGPLLQTAGPQYDRRQCLIRDLEIPILNCLPSSRLGINKTVVFGNRLSQWSFNIGPNQSNSFSQTYCCHIFEPDPSNTQIRLFQNTTNALYGLGFVSTSVSATLVLQNPLFQGASLNSSAVNCFFSGAQIFDVIGAGNPAANLRFAVVGNLSGSGNAGYGLGLTNSNQSQLTGTINLLGTVSNGRWLTAPGVNLTLPQLLQPNDYAQKGTTPAMVAGSTTVTVPWYDNVVQKVTATHATVGGTLGILSVVQTSATQFTINSSNAADTSTVNWQISPLGRSIYISTT